MRLYISNILVFFIFFGSIFATSEKFVDTEVSVKFYFTTLVLLLGVILLMFRKNINLKYEAKKLASLSVLKWVFIVGVLQAIYGLAQYFGLYESRSRSYAILGSFDNPAGYAAVLSLLFPIGIYWLLKSEGLERQLLFFMTAVVFMSVCLSGSRTGISSLIVSTFLMVVVKFRLHLNPKILSYRNTAIVLTFILLVVGLFYLYSWRKESANGRMLIWVVSGEMVSDRPFFGFGPNGFHANYMNYQAKYFQLYPQSQFSQLADNVKHPFNEFIKIAVNYGIVGLLLYLSLLIFVLRKILKDVSPLKIIFLSVFVTFIIWSCFSYPVRYSPVMAVLGYLSLVLFSDRLPSKNLSIPGKSVVVALCVIGIVHFGRALSDEIEWKSVAMKSLHGYTEEMLPKYQKLYPRLRHNPLFLYNYGAELNVAKRYVESTRILSECQLLYNDYDLEMLLADNCYRIGNMDKAIETYQYTSNMVPCRFMPLFRQFEIYKERGNRNEAMAIAQQIVDKEMKIESGSVLAIVKEAKDYLTQEDKGIPGRYHF